MDCEGLGGVGGGTLPAWTVRGWGGGVGGGGDTTGLDCERFGVGHYRLVYSLGVVGWGNYSDRCPPPIPSPLVFANIATAA